jgi:polysaccharide export outer membrane protein
MKLYISFLFTICFCCAAVVSAQPPPSVAVDMEKARGYQLGPGDEVTIKVVGESDFDFVARVNEDGKIDVPFEDQPLVAKCKTERELRADVKEMLSRYLRSPQFNLRVTERESRPPATIYGEVVSPQQVKLMRKATLVELLALSGGVKEEAGGLIQVFRTQKPICADDDIDADWKATTGDATDVPSRMYSLAAVKLGKDEANPVIYPGDVIVVHKAAPVYITGEVNSSQGIFLKEGGTSLTEAIAKVGGVRQGAKTKNVKIYRLKEGSKDREIVAVNLDQIKAGHQKDVMLAPYDIVEVDKAKDGIGKTILSLALGSAKQVASTLSGGIGYKVLY